MEEVQRRKLTVILHADVVGSTELVQRNETVSHERIKDVFHRFSEAIASYGGTAHELRGDALVAEFDRASDAVSASLSFQAENTQFNSTLDDDIRPRLRIGVSLGEVVIADNTLTGAGVVLAQRLEQLAEPGGVCIQGAAYETIPRRLPFEYHSLGEQTVKGFEESIRAYTVTITPGETAPIPEPRTVPQGWRQRAWIVGGAVVGTAMVGGALIWLQPWMPKDQVAFVDSTVPEQPITAARRRGYREQTVRAGRINIKLSLPDRWDAQVVSNDRIIVDTSEFGVAPSPQIVIATDSEGVAHLKVFYLLWLYQPDQPLSVSSQNIEEVHRWVQNEGMSIVLGQYAGGAGYKETRGTVTKHELGSGEEITIVPSVLQIGDRLRHVRVAYAIRGALGGRKFLVFFFHNKGQTREIDDDLVHTITGSATKMFK